jgi:polyisoprenoid-binding protein YceI
MKTRTGLMLGALVLAVPASAQPIPGVVGHLENQLIVTDPAKTAKGNYKLDLAHTSVIGRVLHGKVSYYTFRFNKIDGSYSYDPAKPEATKVEVTIDPASIDSNLPEFDKRLAGPDFLDAGKYPVIKFVSTAIQRTDMNHGTMTGDVSFHGVTKPVTLNVTYNGGGPIGRRIGMGFSATTFLKWADYGMDTGANNITDGVSLIIETEFINQDQQTDVEQVRRLQPR